MFSAFAITERLFSTGSTGAGITVIVTSEVEDSTASVAVSRNTYVPDVENVASVLRAFAFVIVTVPGPLNFDQVVCSVPFGKPSSVAVPDRLEPAGSVIV